MRTYCFLQVPSSYSFPSVSTRLLRKVRFSTPFQAGASHLLQAFTSFWINFSICSGRCTIGSPGIFTTLRTFSSCWLGKVLKRTRAITIFHRDVLAQVWHLPSFAESFSHSLTHLRKLLCQPMWIFHELLQKIIHSNSVISSSGTNTSYQRCLTFHIKGPCFYLSYNFAKSLNFLRLLLVTSSFLLDEFS